jgi:hypothetical protein
MVLKGYFILHDTDLRHHEHLCRDTAVEELSLMHALKKLHHQEGHGLDGLM